MGIFGDPAKAVLHTYLGLEALQHTVMLRSECRCMSGRVLSSAFPIMFEGIVYVFTTVNSYINET